MDAPSPGPCSQCGVALLRSDVEAGRALLILGKVCCIPCLESKSLFCHHCRKPLSRRDFETGKAVTLLGSRYCDCCLVHALLERRRKDRKHPKSGAAPEAPPPRPDPQPVPNPAADWIVPGTHRAPPKTETRRIPLAHLESDADTRRMFSRFIPPAECTLVLKPAGLRGLLSSNLVQLWVDVSEGGLWAVVEGVFQKDDALQGQLLYPPLKVKYDIRVTVRYAKACTAYAGCTMVGLQFEDPSSDLRSFIREVLAETPSIALETARRVKPAAEGAPSAGTTPPPTARPA